MTTPFFDDNGLTIINRFDDALVERGYVLRWFAVDERQQKGFRCFTRLNRGAGGEVEEDTRLMVIYMYEGDAKISRYVVGGVDILKPCSLSVKIDDVIAAID